MGLVPLAGLVTLGSTRKQVKQAIGSSTPPRSGEQDGREWPKRDREGREKGREKMRDEKEERKRETSQTKRS